MRLNVLPIAQESATWYQDGLRFQCTQCGNCCTGGPGYVWITDDEVRRLAQHLKLTVEQTIGRYCRRIGQRLSLQEVRTPQGMYDCIFLREQPAEPGKADGQQVLHSRRTCAIYLARPQQCRAWPFWEGNLASEKAWELASRRCPGINHGPRYSPRQIQVIRDGEK